MPMHTDSGHDLLAELESLLAGEADDVARAANMASLIYHRLPQLNWVGFYMLRGGTLVVGPFQGLPACTRIELGHGVCGTAAAERRTIVVPDVHQFEGHIACDSASQSEIVIPFYRGGLLAGVFDVDSPVLNRFSPEDKALLEAAVAIYEGKRG